MTLRGQTVVVIGGSAGIGLATAALARSEGAEVVLTGSDPERLAQAAKEVDASGTSAFDATDPALLARFFQELAGPIDHVMVTAGAPHYVPLLEIDYLHHFADKAGNRVAPATLGLPPDMPEEVRHAVTFKAASDSKTEITVTEYDWPVGQMMEMSKMGMEQCLDKMAATVARSLPRGPARA